jgi:HEAT repeat protein
MTFLPACVLFVSLSLAADTAAPIKVLVSQLKDKDEAVRLKAAKALGKLGLAARDAIPALLTATKDEDEDVRAVAKKSLAAIEEAISMASKEGDAAKLAKLSKVMAEGDATEKGIAVKGLTGLLGSDDEVVRARTARVIGTAGRLASGALPALKGAAADKDELVRRAARVAISAIEADLKAEKIEASQEKLKPLVAGLKDRLAKNRQNALNAISDLKEEGIHASEAVIAYFLTEKTVSSKNAALDCLERINPDLHKPLLTVLVDREYRNRVEAVRSIGEMGKKGLPAIPFLTQLYVGQDADAHYGESMRLAILKAIKEIDAGQDAYAKLVLSAIPARKPVKGGKGGGVRASYLRSEAIKMGLELVKAEKVKAADLTRPLVEAAQDSGCTVQAINALGALGKDASEALPFLKSLKSNPNAPIREAATEAVKAIE